MSGLPSGFMSTATVTLVRSASELSAPTFQQAFTSTISASFSPGVTGGPFAAIPVPPVPVASCAADSSASAAASASFTALVAGALAGFSAAGLAGCSLFAVV